MYITDKHKQSVRTHIHSHTSCTGGGNRERSKARNGKVNNRWRRL